MITKEQSNQRILGMLETVRFLYDQGYPGIAQEALNNALGCNELSDYINLYLNNIVPLEEDSIEEKESLDEFIHWLKGI